MINPKIVYYKKIEKTNPHPYLKYKKNDNHYYVKCTDTFIDEDGQKFFCGMKEIREDRFKKLLQTTPHVCTKGKPLNQRTLNDYEHLQNQDEPLPNTSDYIHLQIAKFACKHNLALNVMASDDFYEICCDLIAFGMAQPALPPPLNTDLSRSERAKRIFPQMKRDALRKTLISAATRKHKQIMHSYSLLPYTSLALDEGTTASNHNLHFVLECPISDLPSYPFSCLAMNGLKAPDYVNTIQRGFRILHHFGINIGTVVCDGSTAQKKAFDFDWAKSLRHKDINGIKNMIFIPCLCHRCNNAFLTQSKRSDKLREIVHFIHEISKACRNHVSEIGALCPAHCDTRWVYDYNIVTFILAHEQKIRKISQMKLPIDRLKDLRNCLAIFKCLISKFEATTTKFTDAFPILERAIAALLYLHSVGKSQYALELATSLQGYTLMAKDGGLWCLAYCFTPKGRSDMKMRIQKRRNPVIQNPLHFFHLEKLTEEDDIDIETLAEPVCNRILAVNSNNDDEDDEFIFDLNEEEEDDDDQVQDTCDSSDEQSESDDGTPEKIHDINFINYCESAKTCLLNLLKYRGIPRQEREQIITAFNRYIDATNDVFANFMTSENTYSWVQIRNAFPEFEILADIALRLLSASPGEASCERTIKQQRLIQTSRRLNSHKQLLDARMILIST